MRFLESKPFELLGNTGASWLPCVLDIRGGILDVQLCCVTQIIQQKLSVWQHWAGHKNTSSRQTKTEYTRSNWTHTLDWTNKWTTKLGIWQSTHEPKKKYCDHFSRCEWVWCANLNTLWYIRYWWVPITIKEPDNSALDRLID